MKKEITYLILTLFVLASCSNESGIEVVVGDEKMMGFTTELISTKGAVKESFVFGDQFFVYGVNTSEEDFNLSSPNGVEYVFSSESSGGVRVINYGKAESGSENWQYDNPVVWLDGKSTFFAFSPVPYGGKDYGISNYLNKFSLDDLPSLDFTVQGGYDPIVATKEDIASSKVFNKSQVDLLVAYVANQVSGKSINLTFGHALSQITFSVRPMQSKGFLRINSVVLKNVNTNGKYKLGKGWESLSRVRDFAINLNNDVVSLIPATADKIYSINDGDETLLMIPQALSGIVLEIRYAYSEDGKIWPDYEDGKLLSVPLSKVSVNWAQSKNYNYVININPSQSGSFEPGIDAWE